jgi:hypothetical protein
MLSPTTDNSGASLGRPEFRLGDDVLYFWFPDGIGLSKLAVAFGGTSPRKG